MSVSYWDPTYALLIAQAEVRGLKNRSIKATPRQEKCSGCGSNYFIPFRGASICGYCRSPQSGVPK